MNDGISPQQGSVLPRIDDTDRRIIGELTSDGRVSLAELGRRVNLSAPAVAERVSTPATVVPGLSSTNMRSSRLR